MLPTADVLCDLLLQSEIRGVRKRVKMPKIFCSEVGSNSRQTWTNELISDCRCTLRSSSAKQNDDLDVSSIPLLTYKFSSLIACLLINLRPANLVQSRVLSQPADDLLRHLGRLQKSVLLEEADACNLVWVSKLRIPGGGRFLSVKSSNSGGDRPVLLTIQQVVEEICNWYEEATQSYQFLEDICSA